MLLGVVFEQFAAKSPVSVMARGAMEYALNESELDTLFDAHTHRQYTRTLLFSSVTDLIGQVVCGSRTSVHAVYQALETPLGVSLTSVYNKLNGIEPAVAVQLVRHSASRLGAVVEQLGGRCSDWVAGYATRIIDGNHLAATEHRLEETRADAARPLPGLVLAVLDPTRRMVVDAFACEDAYAQERSLLGEVLERVKPRELYLADRNFCTRGFLLGLMGRGASFVIREHANLAWTPAGKCYLRGRIDGARVREQRVSLVGDDGKPVYLRRVVLDLAKPTRDKETHLAILTDLPESAANARAIGKLYRRRWTIEGAFQELESALNAEVSTLGYPRAALFGFCVGLMAYNVLGMVKGALHAAHGEKEVEEVSAFYLADEIAGTRRGMEIAIPAEEWQVFRGMSPEMFAAMMRELADRVRLAAFRRHPRGPKKPAVKRKYDPKKPHVSTAQLLAERKKQKLGH